MPRSSAAQTTTDDATADARPTRERILDVALDLFVEKGYDKTSLREIAEVMGFTKAALYYHFASKEDILFALHLRLHELGEGALRRIGEAPASLATWSKVLQDMVDDLLAQRQLLLLHERNHAAMEGLAEHHRHDQSHQDMEAALRLSLSDPSLAARDRIRLGAAIGAVFATLILSVGTFADIPHDELGEPLREVIRDILPSPRRRPARLTPRIRRLRGERATVSYPAPAVPMTQGAGGPGGVVIPV